MSVEQNKTLVRQFVAAVDAQDAAAFAALAAPEVAQRYTDAIRWLASTFAGHRIEVVELVGEGDTVMARLATRGEHSGVYEGIPPTRKRWENEGFGRYRLSGGMIVEVETIWDRLGVLKQLGATITPPPGAPDE